MQFRGLVVIGFTALMFFMLALAQPIAQELRLYFSLAIGVVLIVLLGILLINDEFTTAHVFTSITIFVSLAALVTGLMGVPTLTTKFMSWLFALIYLFNILLVLLHDWHRYSMFDRMLEAKTVAQAKKPKPQTVFVPVEELIEEPQHFRVDSEGHAQLLRSAKKKQPRKTTSRSVKKPSRK